MEEKKFDLNSLIGFILLGLIMVWYFYMNQPTPETQQINQEQVVKDTATPDKKNNLTETTEKDPAIQPTDSASVAKYQSKLGAFSYASTLPSAKDDTTVLENELVKLTIANKGGQIVEAQLKKFRAHDSLPLYLIKDNNALFNLNFTTADNRVLNSKDLFFEPTFTKNNDSQVLSMKLKISDDKFIEYRYEMKDADYMVDFAIKSVESMI